MRLEGNFRKVLAGLGVSVLLFGILSSVYRSRVESALWRLYMLQPFVSNEIPYFLANVDCPTQMSVKDTAIVTAVIADRSSSTSTQMVTLRGADFDIVPPDPLEVHIPEGERVEISWEITAQAAGIHEVAIPLNPWDSLVCLIRVVDTHWLNFQEGRVLSLTCLLVGSLFVLPRRGITAIQINKDLRGEILLFTPTLLPAILAIAINESIIMFRPTVFYLGLLGLTLLLAAPWFIVWYANTWHLRSRIMPTKSKVFLNVGCFVLGLIFAFVLLFSSIGNINDKNFQLRVFNNIAPQMGIFSALLIPLLGMLLLYPWLDPRWDLPWEAISKRRKAVHTCLYLVASPITILMFLLALNESLLVFF
jgi:hypothetical protein